MKGNVYISIPAADQGNAIPSSITRYDWTEYTYTEEGEVDTTTLVHPTWEQYGDKYKALFGAPVFAGNHVVYELELSWKDSEVSALVALGVGRSEPDYTVMNATEARDFISSNTDSLT